MSMVQSGIHEPRAAQVMAAAGTGNSRTQLRRQQRKEAAAAARGAKCATQYVQRGATLASSQATMVHALAVAFEAARPG